MFTMNYGHMKFHQVMDTLASMTDERSVEIWKKLGLGSDETFGIGLTRLRQLAKTLSKDHHLALQLWNSKNYDGKMLATMVEEPAKVTLDQINEQLKDAQAWLLANKYCEHIISNTAYQDQQIEAWTQSENKLLKKCGFVLLTSKAKNNKKVADACFIQFINQITREIQQEENWTKEAMNYALIAIGSRSKKLNELAIAAARKIGPVKVNYGDNSCQTTDALQQLTHERLQSKLNH